MSRTRTRWFPHAFSSPRSLTQSCPAADLVRVGAVWGPLRCMQSSLNVRGSCVKKRFCLGEDMDLLRLAWEFKNIQRL